MNRASLYGDLGTLMRRLFTWGLLSATIFLVIWYFGGLNLYGYLLYPFLKIFAWGWDLTFHPGGVESAAYVYGVPLGDGQVADLTFLVNRLNSSLVEVVTLLAMWSYARFKDFLRLAAWCLLFCILYHCFNVLLQLYMIRIGPKFANAYNLFWQSSGWYRFVLAIGNFDTLILRYWAGFPIFGLALTANYFTTKREKPAKNKRTKPKKK